MTKNELYEIIDFLTEECINKIAFELYDVEFKPYACSKEESWDTYCQKTDETSIKVYDYYRMIRCYFINQLLEKDNKKLTSEEYQQLLEEYDYWFMKDFKYSIDNVKDEWSVSVIDMDIDEELDYDEQIAEIYKRIDLLDEEYIKKIVDEIGCCSYNIMEPDRWLEEFDEEEERFTPQFRKARKLLKEYYNRRDKFIDKLEEVEGGDPNNYYIDLNHAFAQKYIEYWPTKE